MHIDLYDVCGTNSKKTGFFILSYNCQGHLVVMEPIPISINVNNLLSVLLNTVTLKQISQLLIYIACAKSKVYK